MQFYSPLTVIVGQNGSGKTTIIECLKYITTGDLPPNTKGGAFVHDPGMAGESTVMAEVLLRFKNAAGTKLVASRRLQVSRRKNAGLTMKTLEGTLSYHDDKRSTQNSKRRTISTKCAEMDSELPRHLGISKAILENVIFCHQEDSNWPLSEPGTLKKKFDEIFEATKYTRALDNIKTIRKEATAELKVEKEKYSALVIDKNRAEKLQTSIDRITASISSKEDEYNRLDEKIIELVESNKAFYDGALKYKEIQNRHSTIESQRENKLKIVKDLLEDIDEIKGATDEELVRQREDSRVRVSSQAQRASQLNSQLRSCESSLQKLRQGHQTKLTELGQLMAQAQRRLSALEERKELVVELSKKHGLDGFENGSVDESTVDGFLSRLMNAHKQCSSELDNLKLEGKRSEEKKVAEIFKVRTDENSLRQKKSTTDERILELKHKIRSLTQQIENVKVSEVDIKYQADNLKERRDRLSEVRQWFIDSKVEDQIKSNQSDIKSLEYERDKAHTELMDLNRNFDTLAKVNLKRGDVKKRETGIQTLIEANSKKFKELIGVELVLENADDLISSTVHKTEILISKAEEERTRMTNDRQSLETRYQMNKSKLTDTRKEIAHIEDIIRSRTEGKTVVERIKEAEWHISEFTRDLDNIQFSVKFHETLSSKAKENKKCGACQRGFVSDEELAKFERYCQKTIEKIPKERAQLEDQLKDWIAELADLKPLLSSEITLNKLRDTELSKLQLENDRLKSELDIANSKSRQAQSEVERLKDRLSELRLCRRPINDMIRMEDEINELKREISQLESELETCGSLRTSEEVQDQLDCQTLEIVETRKKLENLIKEKEQRRQTVQSLESQIYEAELELNQKRQQLKERSNFESQKSDLRVEITELENDIKDFEDELMNFQGPLKILENELESIRTRGRESESKLGNKLQAYNKSLNQFEAINRELDKFSRLGIERSVQECQEGISEIESRLKINTEEIANIQKTLSDLDKETSKARAFERNIGDNLRLRSYRSEIEKLEEELNRLDIEGATKASKKYDEEYHKARKYQADLQSEQARLGGEIGIDKKNLKDKRGEMDVEFKDIHRRHRSQLVKVKTIEIANQDLDKYAKALDQAIMKYHSHKMAEINDTVQSLWQKTYQGTDIDKILIKSENENVKSNRSYNYRVVMMKDQVEMDMRGRCSAGQKVLTSIIIRLALAESFGTNCGIMTLDEPTTNLDRDNINALATSLAEIIKERRGQSNFQLVVITHDEDFLNLLGQSDVLDKYWRVSRNLEQKSIIERQRLV